MVDFNLRRKLKQQHLAMMLVLLVQHSWGQPYKLKDYTTRGESMRHQLFQEIEKQRDELNELLQSPKGKQYDVIEQSQKLDQLILEYIKQL
ncbi:hypothetical protein CS063_00800 [Sporanaerobium hydrogeniformans]|uniref:Uncharacterized protein n=1 Tax=Sporanaerobium hydrogeniformans TaxID=3072179 RepID=A0AC61DFL6_9FIRM|nr:hypothetical protein CS063_00800 [Sporanaerobium hydrogeniformans]